MPSRERLGHILASRVRLKETLAANQSDSGMAVPLISLTGTLE